MRPFFTIITVNYNGAEELRCTLTSVFGQSFTNFESIVQDGGSGDDSVAVAESFLPEERLRIHSAADLGIYDAMNRATATSRGQWIIYLNAGDAFHDVDVLSRMHELLADRPPGVVYGNVLGEYGGYHIRHQPAGIELLWLRKPYHHQAMFISGELARGEPFDLDFRIVADHERACRLFRRGVPFGYVDELVATVDMRGGVSKDRYYATTMESIRVFKRHFYRIDRHLLHWLRLLRLVLVKNIPAGWRGRLRRLKHGGKENVP
jgi:glycosyltransferase involved in cell wall biosynthesis